MACLTYRLIDCRTFRWSLGWSELESLCCAAHGGFRGAIQVQRFEQQSVCGRNDKLGYIVFGLRFGIPANEMNCFMHAKFDDDRLVGYRSLFIFYCFRRYLKGLEDI